MKANKPGETKIRRNRMAGMTMSKVTAKGQITVPEAIRNSLDLKQGDKVVFVPEGKRIYIERLPEKVTSDKVFGMLQRPGVAPIDMEKERDQVRIARLRHYEESVREE